MKLVKIYIQFQSNKISKVRTQGSNAYQTKFDMCDTAANN